MIKEDVLPQNYKAMLKHKMAQNILKRPQMLQSLSSIQNQLSSNNPTKYDTLPEYFGPTSRPLEIPAPSLYHQHTQRQYLEYKKSCNIVQYSHLQKFDLCTHFQKS
jgi:hypothetical protein